MKPIKAGLATLLILVFSTVLHAQDPDLHVAYGSGLAVVMNGDIPQAQYEAKASARVNALESLGVQVSAQIYTDQTRILDATVLRTTEGYIEAERVLRSELMPNGLYEVDIEAWVRTELTKKERSRRQRKLVVAVDLSESIRHQGASDGVDYPDRVVQEMLKNALIQQEFQAYTLRDIQEMRSLYSNLNQALGSTLDAASLTRLTLASVWVHGAVESRFSEIGPKVESYFGEEQQGIFYQAYPRITASKIHGGPIPGGSVFKPEGVKGYQLSADRAAQNALVNCGKEAVAALVEAISNHAQKDEVTFQMTIQGIPDLETFRKYKSILGKLRWVKSLEAGDFQSGGHANYTMVYREQPFLLLSQLHRIPGLKVVQSEGFHVTAQYR